MKRTAVALLVAGAFLAAIPAYAHHSFAATYFEDKNITVEGTLVQFMFRNPHSFVEAYIEHRLGREAQIMTRLKEGPQTIPQMVAKNYADTPLHLHAAAGRSMLAHLIQMVKDGRVKTEDGQARIDSTYRL